MTPGETASTVTLDRKEAFPPEALLKDSWPPGAEKTALPAPTHNPTETVVGEAMAEKGKSKMMRAAKKHAVNILETELVMRALPFPSLLR